jgi:hypothetical protein
METNMSPGTKVKMSEELKQGLIEMDCKDHVDEFGDCIGIVEDKVWEYDDIINVRWQPSGLRYMYNPKTLIIWEK